MTTSPDTQPVQPPALLELGPPEFFDLETHTPGLTHTYGDGLYGSGTYGDLLPAVASNFVPLPPIKPPEFLPLADPVTQAPPVLLLKPPEFISVPEARP